MFKFLIIILFFILFSPFTANDSQSLEKIIIGTWNCKNNLSNLNTIIQYDKNGKLTAIVGGSKIDGKYHIQSSKFLIYQLTGSTQSFGNYLKNISENYFESTPTKTPGVLDTCIREGFTKTNSEDKFKCLKGDCIDSEGESSITEKKNEDSGIFKGTFKHGSFLSGSIKYNNGAIEEGIFDPNTNLLKEGKRIYKSGDVLEGTFSSGMLRKGKKTFTDGNIAEGEFDLNTGELIKGEITSNIRKIRLEGLFKSSRLTEGSLTYEDGTVDKGIFEPETISLRKGTRTYLNGASEEGDFDVKSRLLVKGKKIYSDGSSETGTFSTQSGNLEKGKKIFADGSWEEGLFDKNTKNLIDGVRVYVDGSAEKGIFDRQTGEYLKKK